VDMTFETGKIAVPPHCPVHDQMHLDFALDTWSCRGWDGEGCDHRVRAEDLDWIDVTGITMTGVQFGEGG
jgi:hypothetical protein